MDSEGVREMPEREARKPALRPELSSDALRRRLLEAAAELRALAEREPGRARELIDQARRIEALANSNGKREEDAGPPLPRDLSR